METPEPRKRGPRKGSKRIATLQKEAVAAEIRNRVMQNADKLFNAQLCRAVGSIMVFEVVETKKDGRPKTEHVLVSDPNVIKTVLDAGEGANTSVEGAFYIVTEVPPENRAIDSMLDRTFGKATQSLEVTTVDHTELAKKVVAAAIAEGMDKDEAIQKARERYGVLAEDLIGV